MEISEYQNIYNLENSHFFYVGTHDLVMRLLRLYKSAGKCKILDAGCGTGLLLQKLNQSADAMGIDISSEALSYAKKRGLKKVYKASIEKIPFKSNNFDVIVSIDVLYHKQVNNDLKALKEFYRLLKPGGILILRVPAFNWLSGKHDRLVQTKRRYTKERLNNKLVDVGFYVRKLSYSNMFFLPIVFLKRKLESFYSPGISSDIQDLPPLLNRLFLLIQKFETKLLSDINLPFGISVVAVAQKI